MQQKRALGNAAMSSARYYCLDADLHNVGPSRTDEDIRKEIEMAFVWDSWVSYDEVNIEVNHGVVTLTGEVSSFVAKRSAGDDAWDTAGVADVINNIRVHPLQSRPPVPE